MYADSFPGPAVANEYPDFYQAKKSDYRVHKSTPMIKVNTVNTVKLLSHTFNIILK